MSVGILTRPTLVLSPQEFELVRHNCGNGHIWLAAMSPTAIKKRPWRYKSSKDRFCPHCGDKQTEEEPI